MGDHALPASATPVQTNGDSNNRANGNLGGPAMHREDQYAFVRDLWPVKKETKNTYGKTVTVEYENGDKIVISNGKSSFECTDVYIAVSKVDSKDFSAILNPQIMTI